MIATHCPNRPMAPPMDSINAVRRSSNFVMFDQKAISCGAAAGAKESPTEAGLVRGPLYCELELYSRFCVGD